MSRHFDEHMEEQAWTSKHLAVAQALGLHPDRLDEFDYEVEPHESDDGVLYGYNITFSGTAPEELEGRLTGAAGARWIRIGPL